MQAYTYANHPDTTVEESTKRNLNTTIEEFSSTLAKITKKRIEKSKKIMPA